MRSTVLVFLSVAATMIFAVGADAPAQEEEGDCPPYVICFFIDDPPPTPVPPQEQESPYTQWTERCDGGFCAGTSGKDYILGSKVADQIHAWAGADFAKARAGNDEVHGGGDRASDTLWGGGGDDVLWGGKGSDELQPESGDDEAHGGPGSDSIWDGTGDDLLVGGPAFDEIDSGGVPGDADTIRGGDGNDRLNAVDGDGDDVIRCGAGDRDRVSADPDDDVAVDCENTVVP